MRQYSIKIFLIGVIKGYQRIGGFLWRIIPGAMEFSGCRFYPTCSQYGIEAIKKYGVLAGAGRAGLRILKCNIFFRHGADNL